MCQPTQPTFLQLPLHLVGQILTQLEDLQTLGSAILSHPLLYASYKDLGATRVLLAIVRNQIPQDVMPYAIMAYKAQTVDPRHAYTLTTRAFFRRSQRDFLDKYVRYSLLREKNADAVPSFAAALTKTHSAVEYFCNRFIHDVLPLAAQCVAPDSAHFSPTAPSSTEVYRIQKALYRFQVYCNLSARQESELQGGTDVGAGRLRESRISLQGIQHFFSQSSPWVNEQLACIHVYLERVVSRSFDYVAAHDVEWGAHCVDWLSGGPRRKNIQIYLTYGLNFLRELAEAKGFQQQQYLLNSQRQLVTAECLPFIIKNARTDLCASPQWSYRFAAQDQWTDRAFESWLAARPPDGVDGLSSDPFRIWWYAHKHKVAEKCEWQPENALLRRYGYVMWDFSSPARTFSKRRIRELQRRYTDDQSGGGDEDAKFRAEEDMKSSWAKRLAVFEAGGRGYWSERDLSQVVWTEEGTDSW